MLIIELVHKCDNACLINAVYKIRHVHCIMCIEIQIVTPSVIGMHRQLNVSFKLHLLGLIRGTGIYVSFQF